MRNKDDEDDEEGFFHATEVAEEEEDALFGVLVVLDVGREFESGGEEGLLVLVWRSDDSAVVAQRFVKIHKLNLLKSLPNLQLIIDIKHINPSKHCINQGILKW